MTDVIIVVNSGSSSLKFAVFPASDKESGPIITGKVAGIGRKPVLTASVEGEPDVLTGSLDNIPPDATHEWLITRLLERLHGAHASYTPVAAGHRIVHGGLEFTGPVIIDDAVREKLDRLIALAPLHQPHNLAAVDAIAKVLPGVPQIACFDTSFHRTQPRLAQLFGLPRELTDEGILRYGFHGLSYDYIAAVLPQHLGPRADGRVIVAHLGNGASMCAMNGRKSVASSMGFTALDGLVMGTRCGSLDPGVVLHLIQHKGLAAREVQQMLYRKSGLLGVSGISNNMRVLEDSHEPNAKEAIALFCYRAARELGSLTAALGGLDALIFTAGIGENSALVRRLICEQSAWLGIALDSKANDSHAAKISSSTSQVAVHVVPTNEEAVILKGVHTCLPDLVHSRKNAAVVRPHP